MSRPLLLDLFCGAGGAAVGYHRAGFDVMGVDIRPQPEYPFAFVQWDALAFLRDDVWALVPGHWSRDRLPAVIHASPPCQHYSPMNRGNCGNHNGHPDLIAPTRELLHATGLPYVIENVPGAPLLGPISLCGEMFGLKVIRHRNFESNVTIAQPEHIRHRGYAASSYKSTFYYYTVAGHSDGKLGTFEDWKKAMGIDWMTSRKTLTESIPPAYTEYVGTRLLEALRS